MKLSVVVLTKNEEKNIERCLKSINFADEIIIVDDFSTDETINQILKIKNQNDKSKIKIFKNKLENDFAKQRNYGLHEAKFEWILFVDADEIVSEELKKEITSLLRGFVVEKNAFYLRRRDFFWNKELKYGEVHKVREQGIVRLVKKNTGKWMGDVHEVFHTARNIGQMNGFLNHYPHPTLREFINDINNYSSIRAEELFNKGKRANIFEIFTFSFLKFIYNYFLKLGFLDGPPGFAYSFLMSFHSFLVRAKLYQMTRN